MNALAIALSLASLAAAAFGGLLGISVSFAKEARDPNSNRFLSALIQQRHPIINILGSLAAWAIVLYAVPKAALAAVGINDSAAFGLAFAVQLCVIAIAFLLGERMWKSTKY